MGKIVLVLVVSLWAGSALAQALSGTDHSSSLTTTPSNCVAADAGRVAMTISSPSTNAAQILMCMRATATPGTPCTPTSGAAGTWTISPNEKLFWPAGAAPQNGFDCEMASGSGVVDVTTER